MLVATAAAATAVLARALAAASAAAAAAAATRAAAAGAASGAGRVWPEGRVGRGAPYATEDVLVVAEKLYSFVEKK